MITSDTKGLSLAPFLHDATVPGPPLHLAAVHRLGADAQDARDVAQMALRAAQGDAHTPVILGQPGDVEPLLGVVTLEILGLVFDPFHRTLHPMRALLV